MAVIKDIRCMYIYIINTNNKRNVQRQVDEYLEAIRKLPESVRLNTSAFWLEYQNEWPELAAYTKEF